MKDYTISYKNENKEITTLDQIKTILDINKKITIIQAAKTFRYEEVILPIKHINFYKNKLKLVNEQILDLSLCLEQLKFLQEVNEDTQELSLIFLLKSSEEFYYLFENKEIYEKLFKLNKISVYIVIPNTFNVLTDRVTRYLSREESIKEENRTTFDSLIKKSNLIEISKKEKKSIKINQEEKESLLEDITLEKKSSFEGKELLSKMFAKKESPLKKIKHFFAKIINKLINIF